MVHTVKVPNEQIANIGSSDAEIDANNVARWALLRWNAADNALSDARQIKYLKPDA
jgi:CHASE2 domain-containing sensor protein